MTEPNPVDAAIAESALISLIDKLGMYFHPEVDISSYVETNAGPADEGMLAAFEARGLDAPDSDGTPVFTPLEVQHYQHCLNLAWEVFGEGIYDEIKKIEPWKTYFEELDREQGEH